MLTCDREATVVQGGHLGAHDLHVQQQLLQGPMVGLGHELPGGCDVGLGDEQASQPDL